MKKIIGAVSNLGTVATFLVIGWTMVVISWLLWVLVIGEKDLSIQVGALVTTAMGIPYMFINLIDKRYPRKETGNDRDTTQ